jgi:hypothetical protein
MSSQADSGFIVPQAFDGMAAFRMDRGPIRLIRNHEIRDPAGMASPFGPNPYDAQAGGGTTSLEVVVHRRGQRIEEIEVTAEFASLTGTHVNCAGGPSLWDSWITCEETTEDRDQPHGYVFDVPVRARGPVSRSTGSTSRILTRRAPRRTHPPYSSRVWRRVRRYSSASRAAGTAMAVCS